MPPSHNDAKLIVNLTCYVSNCICNAHNFAWYISTNRVFTGTTER